MVRLLVLPVLLQVYNCSTSGQGHLATVDVNGGNIDGTIIGIALCYNRYNRQHSGYWKLQVTLQVI